MPVPARDDLSIFVLNVGQADTSIIRTPEGNIVVIDAVAPEKTRSLLELLGLGQGEPITELIITHPHRDHYSAANSLLEYFGVRSISLAPFWHEKGWGSNQYKTLVNAIESGNMPVRFVAGYNRIYTDDFVDVDTGGTATARDDKPYLELLGPPNSLVRNLEGKKGYGANHLSIMTKLTWQRFSMVFAADAQMENWTHFDSEGMLETKCKVLKAAHHGSKNGTQWERLYRLQPGFVIVSSERHGQHHIPDVIGSAVLKEYHESGTTKLAGLTEDTKTVEILARPTGSYTLYTFEDGKDDNVDLADRAEMSRRTNPTDWRALLEDRLTP